MEFKTVRYLIKTGDIPRFSASGIEGLDFGLFPKTGPLVWFRSYERGNSALCGFVKAMGGGECDSFNPPRTISTRAAG
jgi:hypothetical protein